MTILIDRIPLVRSMLRAIRRRVFKEKPLEFHGSASYWDNRYKAGGDSGKGSYHLLAEFKAEVLNDFVRRHDIRDVIEFGCGDGNQLTLAAYPKYIGYDVSPAAVERCRERFKNDPNKQFELVSRYTGQQCDLSMSLDVIFHLVEDNVFDTHMRTVFDAARRFAVIYSNNAEVPPTPSAPHVRYRQFTRWIETHRPGWQLKQHVPQRHPYNSETGEGSLAEFFFYERP